MEAALAAGAEDLSTTEDGYEIYTPPDVLQAVKQALEGTDVPVEGAEVSQVPQTCVSLEEADARKTLALLEELDDHDDVQKVHSNVDIDADLVEKIQAE